MLRKSLTGLLVLVILAMDWAALHDIIEGEANVWMEWSFLLASMLLASIYIYRRARRSRQG